MYKEEIGNRHLADCFCNTPCEAGYNIRTPEIAGGVHPRHPDCCGKGDRSAEEIDYSPTKFKGKRYEENASYGKASGIQAKGPRQVLNGETKISHLVSPDHSPDIDVDKDHKSVEADECEVPCLVPTTESAWFKPFNDFCRTTELFVPFGPVERVVCISCRARMKYNLSMLRVEYFS